MTSPQSPASGLRAAFHIFFRGGEGAPTLVLLLLLFGGIAESIGLASLLPLLSLAVGEDGGQPSVLDQMVRRSLEWVGLSPEIGVLTVVVAVGIVGKGAFVLFAMNRVGYAVAEMATGLRRTLIEQLLDVRWAYFTRQPAGRFANAISTEATRAGEAYFAAATALSLMIQAAFYFGLAFLVSWQLAVSCILIGTAIGSTLNWLVRKSRRAGIRQSRHTHELVSQLTDALAGIKPLKAMGRHARVVSVLSSKIQDLNRVLKRQVFYRQALRNFQEPLLALVLLAGFFVAFTGFALPFSEILVMSALLAKVVSTMNKVQQQLQTSAACEAGYWNVQAIIAETEAHREPLGGTTEPTLDQGVELRKVTVGFDDKVVLREVDVFIPAGKLTTLIGPSGAGKTTLSDLLLGLVQPRAGTILIDGRPIESLDLVKWREFVGYVPQELFLFHDTILSNITLGDPTVSRADVERALEIAGARDFVEELPLGLDTPAGERGALLSGGQRQRIALARALVRQPRLLILDEVTSALDPATEADICARIRALAGGMTIVAITHQRGWVDQADVIYSVADQDVRQVRREVAET